MAEEKIAKCIYSKECITEKNDSRAHVFPSAIGGRLKPKGILTKRSNEGKVREIEGSFIEIFKELLALIDPMRDRGRAPRQHYVSDMGVKYLQSHGGAFLETVRPWTFSGLKYGVHQVILDGKPKVRRKQVWDFDRIIPAMYVFSNVFAAYKGQKIGRDFKAFVDNPRAIVSSANISLCSLAGRIARGNDAISHTIIIDSDEKKNFTSVYAEIFGLIATVAYFPCTSKIVPSAYSVDITTGKGEEFFVESGFFDDVSLMTQGKSVRETLDKALLNLLFKIRNRQFERFAYEVLEEALSGGLYDTKYRLRNAYDLIAKSFSEMVDPWVADR